MSQRRHSLCRVCWDDLHPDRKPHYVLPRTTREDLCCRCETLHSSGIYLLADSKGFKCAGVEGFHND